MSYRTYVNGVQIFGNNELPPRWERYLKENKILSDDQEEEDTSYAFDTSDFMGILQVMEEIVQDYEKERQERIKRITEDNPSFNALPEKKKQELCQQMSIHSIFDLRHMAADMEHEALFDLLMEQVESGYALLPYTFFRACEKDLEPMPMFFMEGRIRCYRMKSGRMIHIEAH